ncbi:MAG TPA: hypothetical protein VGF32_07765 [Streptosporangiaceae bacterium]
MLTKGIRHEIRRNQPRCKQIDRFRRCGGAPSLSTGRRLTLTNDLAYDLVMKVAAGELDQVEEIVAILAGATAPRL